MKLPILQHIEFLHWCIDARPPKLFQIQHFFNIVFFSHSIVFWTWHRFLSICPHLQFCIGIVASLFRNTKPLQMLRTGNSSAIRSIPDTSRIFAKYFQEFVQEHFREFAQEHFKEFVQKKFQRCFSNIFPKH